MGYKIEKIDEDNDDNEYEYLDETLHFLDEVEDEEIIQDVLNRVIDEHEKEKEIFFKWFKKGVESMFGHFNAPKFYDMDKFWEEYREKFEEIYKNE